MCPPVALGCVAVEDGDGIKVDIHVWHVDDQDRALYICICVCISR